MAIALFGYKLAVPLPQNEQVVERIAAACAKKSDERKILQICVESLLPQIVATVNSMEITPEQVQETSLESVVEFYLSELKARANSHFSVYEDLVLEVINQEADLKNKRYIANLRAGKACAIPDTFPSVRKRADALVIGKLRSDIGDSEKIVYLRRRRLISEIKQISGEMFFALNNGATPDQAIRFMRLRYELRHLESNASTNEHRMKVNILNSIKTGIPLELVHIKCGRYVYPNGDSFKVLEDSDDAEVMTKHGLIYKPRRETDLFARLDGIKQLFEKFGITVDLLYLLSDQDMDDYFPEGNTIVSAEDVQNAKESLARYKANLQLKIKNGEVLNLKDYLQRLNKFESFIRIREIVLQSLARGKSIYPEGFVEGRINYRYQSNNDIFRQDPGRRVARDQIYALLASLNALGILGDRNMLLVEDDRGDENQFIGGHKQTALPVLFTKLREKLM